MSAADDIRKYINLVEDAEEWADEYESKLEVDKSFVLEQMGHLFQDLGEMPDAFYEEAAHALRNECGRFITHGFYRAVYDHKHQPGLVVKIEGGETDFPISNIREAELWDYADGNEDLAMWFAPVVSESGDRWVIHQKKTGEWNPVDFPKHLPTFFRDADIWKFEQWGSLDNRIVCHDYGGMHESSLSESWVFAEVEVDAGAQSITFKDESE